MPMSTANPVATMRNLLRTAAKSAGARGHRLGLWDSLNYRAEAYCLDCERGVWVIAFPQPNEIDIAGEAVALNCPDA